MITGHISAIKLHFIVQRLAPRLALRIALYYGLGCDSRRFLHCVCVASCADSFAESNRVRHVPCLAQRLVPRFAFRRFPPLLVPRFEPHLEKFLAPRLALRLASYLTSLYLCHLSCCFSHCAASRAVSRAAFCDASCVVSCNAPCAA